MPAGRALWLAAIGAAALAGPAIARAESVGAACEQMPKALAGAFAEASDCALAERTLRQALATAADGTITRWSNLRTGVGGAIRLAAAARRDGNVCRRAELTVTRAGESKRAAAVACLKDGAWAIVE
jgi:surface antigen